MGKREILSKEIEGIEKKQMEILKKPFLLDEKKKLNELNQTIERKDEKFRELMKKHQFDQHLGTKMPAQEPRIPSEEL